jgi:hypothetical protein
MKEDTTVAMLSAAEVAMRLGLFHERGHHGGDAERG